MLYGESKSAGSCGHFKFHTKRDATGQVAWDQYGRCWADRNAAVNQWVDRSQSTRGATLLGHRIHSDSALRRVSRLLPRLRPELHQLRKQRAGTDDPDQRGEARQREQDHRRPEYEPERRRSATAATTRPEIIVQRGSRRDRPAVSEMPAR